MNNLDFVFEVMKVLKLTVVLVACSEYSKCQNCMVCKVYLTCYKRKEYSCLEMLIKIKGFLDSREYFEKINLLYIQARASADRSDSPITISSASFLTNTLVIEIGM